MKRVIQTYKPPGHWIDYPPGLGDFIRGACHLFEKLQGVDIELRIDVSQTGFASLLKHDDSIFHVGEESRIASAGEYFDEEAYAALHDRLMRFLHSEETELYVCTNLGSWSRLTLSEGIRRFIEKFYHFGDEVERMTSEGLQASKYEVLSVRCGDEFFRDPNGKMPSNAMRQISSIIERHVLPRAQSPVALTSDCHALKAELAQRYGMLTLPHQSQHGGYGNALPVAMDLCMVKNSRFNYHINFCSDWWSGFSHYTSLIFLIPSMNFRAPSYVKEEVTAQGRLVTNRGWRTFWRA